MQIVHCVLSCIMMPFKLGDIAMQMLTAHVLKCAITTPLKQYPERLSAICMCLSTHVFTNTVTNRFVTVAFVAIAINRVASFYIFNNR